MRLRLLGVLGLGMALGAQTVAVSPKVAATYAKLTAQAAAEQGHKRAETLGHVAEFDFVYADAAFRAGQTDAMMQHLTTMQQHAEAALALLQPEVALGKKDGMKHLEQSLQRIGYNLKDLIPEVGYQVRPQLQTMANHFADLRAQVLEWMFAPKKRG